MWLDVSNVPHAVSNVQNVNGISRMCEYMNGPDTQPSSYWEVGTSTISVQFWLKDKLHLLELRTWVVQLTAKVARPWMWNSTLPNGSNMKTLHWAHSIPYGEQSTQNIINSITWQSRKSNTWVTKCIVFPCSSNCKNMMPPMIHIFCAFLQFWSRCGHQQYPHHSEHNFSTRSQQGFCFKVV